VDLDRAYEVLKEVSQKLDYFKDRQGFIDTEALIYELDDNSSAEEIYMANEAYLALEKLEEAKNIIDNATAPVLYEGILVKQTNGRYMIQGTSYEFSSGSPLEYWVKNDAEVETWMDSRIEHNGYDYYIYDYGREKDIEGMKVRVKQRR